jgi:hypothetical protein
MGTKVRGGFIFLFFFAISNMVKASHLHHKGPVECHAGIVFENAQKSTIQSVTVSGTYQEGIRLRYNSKSNTIKVE